RAPRRVARRGRRPAWDGARAPALARGPGPRAPVRPDSPSNDRTRVYRGSCPRRLPGREPHARSTRHTQPVPSERTTNGLAPAMDDARRLVRGGAAGRLSRVVAEHRRALTCATVGVAVAGAVIVMLADAWSGSRILGVMRGARNRAIDAIVAALPC